jgi:hypothetical protein
VCLKISSCSNVRGGSPLHIPSLGLIFLPGFYSWNPAAWSLEPDRTPRGMNDLTVGVFRTLVVGGNVFFSELYPEL